MDNLDKLISIVTSGRLSQDSLIWKMFHEISLNSPFVGYGFGSVMTTDMGFLDIFAMSGMIGLLFYLLIFAIVFLKSLFVFNENRKEKILLLFIWIILLFSSIGGSALTTNRLSVFIWIITTLVMLKISNKYLIIRLFKKNQNK